MDDHTSDKRARTRSSRHLPASDGTGGSQPPQSRVLEGVLWVTLAIGLIPYVGLLVGGTWNQAELGVAALMVIGTTAALVAEYKQRRRNKQDRDRPG